MKPDHPEAADYQPLTNPKRGPSALVDEFSLGFKREVVSNSEGTHERLIQISDPTCSTEYAFKNEQHRVLADSESRILRKGHFLSFVGVFLFSVMLYFRPYEWTPALSWLSSSAFWIAAATILIFIPTQLALEAQLTILSPEVKCVLALAFIALLSIPFSLSPGTGIVSYGDYLKVIVIFIVMTNVVRSEKRLMALLAIAFVASAIVSLAALRDYMSGNLALKGSRIEGYIGGIFGNPNDLALHLVTMTPLAVALFLGTSNIVKKLFYISCAGLFLVGIVATFSRGGFLGLAVTVFLMVLKYVRKLRLLVVIAVMVLGLGFLTLVPGDLRARIFTTGDASAISRADDLKRSLYLAVRHPLLGVGFGNYILYSNQAKATHNAYTQVASEIGLVGATFYVLFLVSPLKPLLRIERETRATRKKNRHAYFLSMGLQVSIVGYMVTSFFASVPYVWYSYYLVAYSIAFRRIFEGNPSSAITKLPNALENEENVE